ncbi:MAG: hypothetical protein IJZ16_07235 [Clostridia bacterium]|nr:hypothetical protein [Clostridia bacterium]
MNRTEYLNLCKKVSILLRGISDDCLVEYDGITYYPQGYQLSFTKGQAIHTAILHDLKAHSVMYCSLGSVKRKE